MTRLVGQFLKAGVMAEEQFIRTSSGTPQGGILSPLLANIALGAIEERYERWVHKKPVTRKNAQTDPQKAADNARRADRQAGRLVCLPIRYCDDFVVLVRGSREQAETEKDALAEQPIKFLGRVERFRLGRMSKPDFTKTPGEPDAERKSHVRFGGRSWETDGGDAAQRP